MEKETKEKCLCEKTEPVESDSSTSDSSTPTKDKKSKISLFSLRKAAAAPLHFTSKRNKNKLNQSNGSNPQNACNSISKKSPKWFKINCIKKDPKVAFNQSNQNCCKCACNRRTDESTSTTQESIDETKIRPVVEAASTSTASTSTDSAITNSEDETTEEGNKEPASLNNEPQIPQEERNNDPGRGIYDTASSTQNIVVDMHWYVNLLII